MSAAAFGGCLMARKAAHFKEVPASKAYRFLEAGPLVLVTTAGEPWPNVLTVGFHMVVQHDPPLLGLIIGPWDHSYRALRETGECVVGVPAINLAEKAVDIGNCSGAEVDKFAKFKLTPLPAHEVAAPLIAECLVNLECRVADTTLGDKYNLFILEVVRIWHDPERKEGRTLHHRGDGTFAVDGRTLDLRKRMVRWKQFQD